MVKAGIDMFTKTEQIKLVIESIVFSIQEIKARIEKRCTK